MTGRLINLAGKRYSKLVVLGLNLESRKDRQAYWDCRCDCGSMTTVPGYRLRTGRTRSCGCLMIEIVSKRQERASYNAAHLRCKRDRGPVQVKACVDCGRPADDWSYNHDDPDELISPEGLPYSLSPSHYSPRCRSCHRRLDARRPTHCKWGHEYTPENTYEWRGSRHCRACARARSARRRGSKVAREVAA